MNGMMGIEGNDGNGMGMDGMDGNGWEWMGNE